MSMKDVYNANNLWDGYLKAREGVEWKESVQKYEANLLLNIYRTRKSIIDDTYTQKPMTEFKLCERGHVRQIKAQHVSDRVVQRSFNDNVLIPRTRPKLIYDNGASLKNKGLDFGRRRFEMHLRKAAKQYGNNAYILTMDFTKYYDNIQHRKLLRMYRDVLEADEYAFFKQIVHDFRIDVSYMTDEEYSNCMDVVFNAIEHAKIPEALKTGAKYMDKSLGIGSQSSQISGIYYPHRIDDYCKTVRGIKFYGRYMDDTYIIMRDKKELMAVYSDIQSMCSELGIFINKKKTRIRHLTGWITWLKINYKLKLSGGIIRKVHSSTFRRERRKIKQLRRLYLRGKITYNHALECYKSWRGTYKRYDSGTKLKKLDEYFKKLFMEEKNNGREK